MLSYKSNKFYGDIGEVVNTLVCGTSMHEFDPHISPHCEICSNFSSLINTNPNWISFFVNKTYFTLKKDGNDSKYY